MNDTAEVYNFFVKELNEGKFNYLAAKKLRKKLEDLIKELPK